MSNESVTDEELERIRSSADMSIGLWSTVSRLLATVERERRRAEEAERLRGPMCRGDFHGNPCGKSVAYCDRDQLREFLTKAVVAIDTMREWLGPDTTQRTRKEQAVLDAIEDFDKVMKPGGT